MSWSSNPAQKRSCILGNQNPDALTVTGISKIICVLEKGQNQVAGPEFAVKEAGGVSRESSRSTIRSVFAANSNQ